VTSVPRCTDRLSKQKKINQEISELNNTIDQMDLTGICGIFHSTGAEYTFFSATHGIFCKIDHILEHKASLNKNKKIEITSYVLADHSGMKLEINSK
jgi:hypothetical protein